MFIQPTRPLTRARALSCIATNQLVTPGLGSIFGGRYVAGVGQLLLATAGVVLVLIWFVKVMKEYYSQMGDQPLTPSLHAALGLTGLAVFVVAWFWSLISSIGMYRESQTPLLIMPGSKPSPTNSNPPRLGGT